MEYSERVASLQSRGEDVINIFKVLHHIILKTKVSDPFYAWQSGQSYALPRLVGAVFNYRIPRRRRAHHAHHHRREARRVPNSVLKKLSGRCLAGLWWCARHCSRLWNLLLVYFARLAWFVWPAPVGASQAQHIYL